MPIDGVKAVYISWCSMRGVYELYLAKNVRAKKRFTENRKVSRSEMK